MATIDTTKSTGTATTAPTSTPPVTPSTPSTAPIPTTYKVTNNTQATYGEQSPSVKALQLQLNGMGASLDPDGKYGPLTKAAYDKYLGSANTSTTNTNTSPGANSGSTEAPTTPTPPAKTQDQLDLEKTQADYQTQATNVQNTITNIQNGSIPLSAGEQAQVDGLKQQFQQLIDQQKLTNAGAEGIASVRGYQTGSAEYDPTFQVKTIGSIMTAGANKVADLNIKMASAVASLTQAFKDNKIAGVKQAWDIYNQASKARTDALAKTIKDTQDFIRAEQEKQEKVTQGIDEITKDAAKNGADPEILKSIGSAKTVSQAIALAGDSLQTATGALGDYLQYKRDTQRKGLTPMDYSAWTDRQTAKENSAAASKAYSTAYASARGKAAGTPSGITEDENGNLIATGNLSTLDIGRYNLAATRATKTFRDTQAFKAATNAGFYISKIKAATEGTGSIQDQEILDSISQFNTGGGRVTESQVNIILKGKSFGDTMNSWSNKVKNGGILSDKQRKQALELANLTADKFVENYDQKYKPIEQNLQKQGIPKEFWGIPSTEQLKGELDATEGAFKDRVDGYVQAKPEYAETIANLYELPGWSDQDVWDYIQQM